MIIWIIILTVIFISVIGIIVHMCTHYDKSGAFDPFENGWSVWFYIGIAGVIIALPITLASKSDFTYERDLVSYNKLVTELRLEKEVLLSVENMLTADDSDNEMFKSEAIVHFSSNVADFNAKVARFKSNILDNKLLANNPWINWFVPRSWQVLDENVVDYITADDINNIIL